jgi:hypothetical protein
MGSRVDVRSLFWQDAGRSYVAGAFATRSHLGAFASGPEGIGPIRVRPMKLPLYRLGVLTVGACLGILGCEYGRGNVRHQADGMSTDTNDEFHAGIPKGNHAGGNVNPGTWSKQGQDIEQSLNR